MVELMLEVGRVGPVGYPLTKVSPGWGLTPKTHPGSRGSGRRHPRGEPKVDFCHLWHSGDAFLPQAFNL
jgi:hypothetical protein